MGVCRTNLYIFVMVETGTDLNYLSPRLPLAFCPLIAAQFLHRLPLRWSVVCQSTQYLFGMPVATSF